MSLQIAINDGSSSFGISVRQDELAGRIILAVISTVPLAMLHSRHGQFTQLSLFFFLSSASRGI